jgi:hypothetical protein
MSRSRTQPPRVPNCREWGSGIHWKLGLMVRLASATNLSMPGLAQRRLHRTFPFRCSSTPVTGEQGLRWTSRSVCSFVLGVMR